jgi:hypothetical protein
MSGGGDEANLVEVAAEFALVPASLNKLDQAQLSQQVQVALDGSDRPVEDSSQGLHFWEAETCLII